MNDITQDSVYIAAGARTPMGGLQGSLSELTAVELGASAIRDAITRAGLSGDDEINAHFANRKPRVLQDP